MKEILIKIVLSYLKFFAKLQLKKINPVIIGVGGSAGKSSTCALISEVLSEKYKVKQGKGKNSETGIPLNILDLDIEDYTYISWLKILLKVPLTLISKSKKFDYFVVEMGIDSPVYPKNMEYLLEIIKPNIGILTNINIEHSENFDKFVSAENPSDRKKEILKLTANQEQMLLKSIDESGWSIVNLDDSLIKKTLPLKSKVITVSLKDKNADYFVSKIENTLSSFSMRFRFLKDEYELLINQSLPRTYAYDFIYAIAVSFIAGINIKESIEIVKDKFVLPPGRFSVFEGVNKTVIFDSSYNSSYEAVNDVLELVKGLGNNRKLGILGDMRELGSLSETQHKMLAKSIMKNLDSAILIGPQMNSFVAPILSEKRFKFEVFDNFSNASGIILNKIKEKDFIVVKGSQNGLFLERVVEMLLKNKEDVNKLARRGRYWDQKRKKSN